jgi:hypothetical protein
MWQFSIPNVTEVRLVVSGALACGRKDRHPGMKNNMSSSELSFETHLKKSEVLYYK